MVYGPRYLYFTAIGRASALVTLELLPYSYTHPLPISALVNSSTQVSSWQNHLFNTGTAKEAFCNFYYISFYTFRYGIHAFN